MQGRAAKAITAGLVALCLAQALAWADVRVVKDIAYKSGADLSPYERERCLLDLYLPGDSQEFPAILWFHGGGLKGGDKSEAYTVALARRFAEGGAAVAVANYRLYPQAKFPNALEDGAAAFAWLRTHIAEYGGSAGRLFLSGHSAGGYICAMLGADPSYLEARGLSTDDIAGVIPVSGQMITHSSVREERGIPRTTPIIDAAAPAYYARADAPPFLNLWGSEDMAARAEENLYFVAAFKAAGHEHIAGREFTGRDHGAMVKRIPEPDDPVTRAILDFVLAPH